MPPTARVCRIDRNTNNSHAAIGIRVVSGSPNPFSAMVFLEPAHGEDRNDVADIGAGNALSIIHGLETPCSSGPTKNKAMESAVTSLMAHEFHRTHPREGV